MQAYRRPRRLLQWLGVVLVSDPLAEEGLSGLRATPMSKWKCIRTGTRNARAGDRSLRCASRPQRYASDGEIIDAGTRLKATGRAGVGVIISTSTRRRKGNHRHQFPDGNTLGGGAHGGPHAVFGARSQAHHALVHERRNRSRFTGVQIAGKPGRRGPGPHRQRGSPPLSSASTCGCWATIRTYARAGQAVRRGAR